MDLIHFMGMFLNCSSLLALDLSAFNTYKALFLNSMFYNCDSLESLNLSSFSTSNCISFDRMFFNCNKLKSLDLSNFDTSKGIYLSTVMLLIMDNLIIKLSNIFTKKIWEKYTQNINYSF